MHFSGIFQYKPVILDTPDFWNPPYEIIWDDQEPLCLEVFPTRSQFAPKALHHIVAFIAQNSLLDPLKNGTAQKNWTFPLSRYAFFSLGEHGWTIASSSPVNMERQQLRNQSPSLSTSLAHGARGRGTTFLCIKPCRISPTVFLLGAPVIQQ